MENGRGVRSELIPGEIGAAARSGLVHGPTGVVAIVMAFLVVTVAAGLLLVARQRRQLRASAEGFVGAFVEFRASELGRWLDERRANAAVAGRD
ncbi:MAG TPA: hypothetical protein VHL80_20725, partial [Polyangia bacterium]|nr:hypothetical protein [Polyangia bacterium]